MDRRRWVVNGRFLGAEVTGLQRTARSLLLAVQAQGWHAEVIAPATTRDPLADRRLPTPPGRYGAQVFEQVLLPVVAGRRRVLSLTNTAPLAARHSVVMVHDLAPLVGPQWYAPSMQAYGRAVLASARRAEHVLTVSETVADELRTRGARQVSVVGNAVDASFAPASDARVAAVRRELGLHRPFALFVGWADPRKDLALAVAAHVGALAQGLDHDLVLLGRPHATFAPVDVPVLPTVRRVGYLPDDGLRALLTGAVCLLYPSRYEGFGLPPLEAWACGTPALVSDIPVLRESTAGQGVLLPRETEAWVEALAHALRGEIEVPKPSPRTWDDAGRELLQVLGRLDG